VYDTPAQGDVRAEASVTVHVQATKPVGKIAGGNRRVSLPASLVHGARKYVLDATSSFLPDRKIGGKHGGTLAYSWECARFVKVADDDVGVRLFPCADVTSDATTSSTLRVDAARLREETFNFAPSLVVVPTFTSGCATRNRLVYHST